MTKSIDDHMHCPNRGPGHYSDDGRRWWDGTHGHWFAVQPESDTLQIELEDVGDTSWDNSALTTLATQYGSATYRFVGVATSADPRWPTYRIVGGAFICTNSLNADLPPQDRWSPGMKTSLKVLRGQLIEEGWLIVGQGDTPWSDRYTRPCIDAPEDAKRARQNGTGSRQLW